jgi:aspartyl-tRNA(Asn)/glutamyl-tRNA(Gln) amidotransferase subunit A
VEHTGIHWLSLAELARKIALGEVTSLEATEDALARAATIGAEMNAFVVLDARGAVRAAREADRRRAAGESLGALHGVPVTVKDLMLTRGMPTTAGSRAPGLGLSASRDAPVVRRLRRAGAIVIGKNNLNEFAYGVTGENAHFGTVLNPWDRGRMSGGSSSGSAAALAAGIGYGSVGTDTRGSIRIPAACCGVSGIKPTRGLVPTEGVFPLSWTLDHTGPMARTAGDLAALLAVMAGGVRSGERFARALERPLDGLTLGVCPFFFADVDPEVAVAVRRAIDELVRGGVRVVEVEIPLLADCLPASAAIAASEGLAVHQARLARGAEGYGAPVLARLEGAYAFTGADLARAEAFRRELVQAYRRAFRKVDVMAGPTLPGVPAPIGSPTMRVGGVDENIVSASCRLVAPQNMTGVPAASVPCGFSSDGLPIGLQIWATAGADDVVLGVAHQYQARTEWHRAHPQLDAPPLRSTPPGVEPTTPAPSPRGDPGPASATA